MIQYTMEFGKTLAQFSVQLVKTKQVVLYTESEWIENLFQKSMKKRYRGDTMCVAYLMDAGHWVAERLQSVYCSSPVFCSLRCSSMYCTGLTPVVLRKTRLKYAGSE